MEFKGKRVDNGQLVEGYYFVAPLTAETWGCDHFSSGVKRHCISNDAGVVFEVDPETVTEVHNPPAMPAPLSAAEVVVNEVFAELRRAEAKFPGWPDNIFEQLSIIGEEFGELQQAALQAKYEDGDPSRIREEGIQ